MMGKNHSSKTIVKKSMFRTYCRIILVQSIYRVFEYRLSILSNINILKIIR